MTDSTINRESGSSTIATSTWDLDPLVARTAPAAGFSSQALTLTEVEQDLFCAEARIHDDRELGHVKMLLNAIAEKDPNLTLFQTSEWLAAAADIVIAKRTAEVRILLGFEDTQPIAALPLSICGPPFCRVAQSLGGGLAQYSDILLRENSRGLRALTAAVRAMTDVDAFVFRCVREDARVGALLLDLKALTISRAKAPYLSLKSYADFEAFLDSKPKKSQQRARSRRRAERAGALTFEIVESSSRAVQLARYAIDMKRRWIRAQALRSTTLTDERWCGALLKLVSSSNSRTRAVITAVHLDAEIAAIEIGFVKDETYYAFLGAFELKFKSWSPSKLAMEETIRWCFAGGIAIYDILPAEEPYKAEWTNAAVDIADWLIPRTARGEIGVKLVEHYLRPAARRIYTPFMRALRPSVADR